jgi:rhodanese-related sulfurtransferase
MRNLFIFALPFLFFVGCNAQTQTKTSSQSIEEIALSDSTVIVDVRTPGEFADGHIEKAINIPVDLLAGEMEQLKSYQTIITVCRSGSRSARAKTILENAGFTNVRNGGGWQALDESMKQVKK